MVAGFYEMFASIDIYKTVIVFLIYFTGGFFLYGAFFAAIGSAVDNLQDASQFTLPISLPIIASLMFMGVILEIPIALGFGLKAISRKFTLLRSVNFKISLNFPGVLQ